MESNAGADALALLFLRGWGGVWAGALLDGLDFEVAERSVEVQKE